jgi:hypothetical protein
VDLFKLVMGCVLFVLGQTGAWYQSNLQFFNSWAKAHPILLSVVLGIPISYLYIIASQYTFQAFNGDLWPSRLLAFAMGIVVFTILAWVHLDQGVTMKTAVSLMLATTIVLIQVFW